MINYILSAHVMKEQITLFLVIEKRKRLLFQSFLHHLTVSATNVKFRD